MRVTNLSTFNEINRHIRDSRADYTNKQLEISSGKKHAKRSDNVLEMSTIQKLKRTENSENQWLKNASHGLEWAQVSTSKIDQALDQMHRVNELVIEANNGTRTVEDRKNIAAEINTVIEGLVSLGNVEYNGTYLFAGTTTDTAPLEVTRDGEKITAVTYNGDGVTRKVQNGEATQISYGVPGGGANGLFQATSKSVDTFATLVSLRDELLSGDQVSDATADRVQSSLDHVVTALVDGGINQQRLVNAQKHSTTSLNLAAEEIGNREGIDLAKSITELSQLEASFQASLQMAARMNGLSLSNYI